MADYQKLYPGVIWDGQEVAAGTVIPVDETVPEQAAQLALFGSGAESMAGVSQIPADATLLAAGVIPLFAALNLPNPVAPPAPLVDTRGRNFFEPARPGQPQRQPQAPATPPRESAPPVPPPSRQAPPTPPPPRS